MSFNKFLQSILPTVRAEEEEVADLVNPQAVLREDCSKTPHLAHLYARYEKCSERVLSRTQTTETCTEEFFDYLHELDHCVAHSLFNHLK